ncbi:MAG: Fe-S cluster assembly protein SufD [Alphaproteobacteria bacterium]|nr:Fe-S cluster assembly protein SufD [Alphaproteobacteria bacterium]
MSAVVDFPIRPEARPYLDAFGHRLSGEPEWLDARRRRGLTRFAEQGFPSRRSEAWRYIDLRALEEKPMLPAGAVRTVAGAVIRSQLAEAAFPATAHRLVLVDGRYAPELSAVEGLPSGVWVGGMGMAIANRPDLVRSAIETPLFDTEPPFGALNAAFFGDGFVLDIAPGVALDQPIEIVHLASGEAGESFHTRSLVTVGAGSHASIFETFVGKSSYWRNDVVELRLAAGAEFGCVALVEEATEALHIGELLAVLGPASRLTSLVLLLGGRTVRHEATIRSDGPDTHCALHGAFVLSGRQEANIVTTIDHAAPGGETREIFKGVAAGRAHGAFQGRITVRPGAQKVDAHQLSRNLVLSPRAAIDTKPELEIYADDVKCSHGAAVGDLDEAALFYLRARGIGREEARHLLIEAFVREVVELVEWPPLREHVLSRLARRLAMLEE